MARFWVNTTALLSVVNPSLANVYPTIETSLGKVSGHYKLSYGGRRYAGFEGIPYAKPPIADLRFEPPVEAEAWSGIWNATTVHTCLQLHQKTGVPIGSEDCLYLNVYVPEDKLNKVENLDVIVHIHGGAFKFGNPEETGPGFLMDRNVVSVSMNYRLGALGFLSTQDNIVPGNMGLKDQVMALRWIQKHIANFGGNPNSVTITGVSAGGVSVHLHYLSPLSKELFHRGIAQGGTALSAGAIKKVPLENTKRLAASIGCDTSLTKELVICLKQRPAEQVIQYLRDNNVLNAFLMISFSPVIEKQSPGAFIVDYPYNLLKSGRMADLPLIGGSTTEEGIAGAAILNYKYDDLNMRWNEILPYLLGYEHTVAESDKITVSQKIKHFYLNDNNVTEDNIQPFIKLFSDRCFFLGLEKSARLQAKMAKSPFYCYIYGYVEDEEFEGLFGIKRSYGVGHGSDSHFLYTIKSNGITFPKEKLSESDEKMKELLLDFVTSFARDGKPVSNNITWNPVDNSSDLRYLFFHNNETKTVSKGELAPREFWKSLPLKEDEYAEKMY